MTKYPIEVDEELWDLFKGTIPSGQKINLTFQEFIRERVREAYSVESIEENLQFDDSHVAYFEEHVANDD